MCQRVGYASSTVYWVYCVEALWIMKSVAHWQGEVVMSCCAECNVLPILDLVAEMRMSKSDGKYLQDLHLMQCSQLCAPEYVCANFIDVWVSLINAIHEASS